MSALFPLLCVSLLCVSDLTSCLNEVVRTQSNANCRLCGEHKFTRRYLAWTLSSCLCLCVSRSRPGKFEEFLAPKMALFTREAIRGNPQNVYVLRCVCERGLRVHRALTHGLCAEHEFTPR